MTYYAINATRGKEFEVESELTEMGLHPWVPRQLASKYVKEKRSVVWYDRPYVGKLLFSIIPAVYFRDVFKLKHVIGKPIKLNRLDIEGDPSRNAPGLKDFQAAVREEYEDMQRRKENSEYRCQYEPGQALRILDGPFADQHAVFLKAIRQAHDEYHKLRLEMAIMGRKATVELDPDKVGAV